jgi:hypothetical protein
MNSEGGSAGKVPVAVVNLANEVAGPMLVGIEPTLSFKEIMVVYGWKYHKVYRYFMGHPRLGVKFKFNPGKRPKRFYDVPVSVVKAEWEMMHSVNKDKADEWERLHPYRKSA